MVVLRCNPFIGLYKIFQNKQAMYIISQRCFSCIFKVFFVQSNPLKNSSSRTIADHIGRRNRSMPARLSLDGISLLRIVFKESPFDPQVICQRNDMVKAFLCRLPYSREPTASVCGLYISLCQIPSSPIKPGKSAA